MLTFLQISPATPEMVNPTHMGWIIACSYYLVAFLCRRRTATLRELFAHRTFSRGLVFWTLITMLFITLGLCRQFGLIHSITDWVREQAISGGWYRERRDFQFKIIVAVLVVGMLGLIVLGWMARHASRRNKLALFATITLLAFLAAAATSHHDLDALLRHAILGLKLNWLAELAGITLIAFAAWWPGSTARIQNQTESIRP